MLCACSTWWQGSSDLELMKSLIIKDYCSVCAVPVRTNTAVWMQVWPRRQESGHLVRVTDGSGSRQRNIAERTLLILLASCIKYRWPKMISLTVDIALGFTLWDPALACILVPADWLWRKTLPRTGESYFLRDTRAKISRPEKAR